MMARTFAVIHRATLTRRAIASLADGNVDGLWTKLGVEISTGDWVVFEASDAGDGIDQRSTICLKVQGVWTPVHQNGRKKSWVTFFAPGSETF